MRQIFHVVYEFFVHVKHVDGLAARETTCRWWRDDGRASLMHFSRRLFFFSLAECGGKLDLMAPETTASQLFDVLAGCISELINENNEAERFEKNPTKLGFTFSFPCVQSVCFKARIPKASLHLVGSNMIVAFCSCGCL